MFKLIEKKRGLTSFQAIREFQREHQIKKIGHTGTLDPLAQGLLLVATDDYTKLIPYIKNKDKEYLVEAKLGFISQTYDAEGPINHFSDYIPSEDEVQEKIERLTGQIKQYPPAFSAKKINGQRSYQLARQNQVVALKPSDVMIYYITDLKYQYPYLSFRTKVSNGTYIRSLIHDLGQLLKTGAYITYLERTMVNGLKWNDPIDLHQLLGMKSVTVNQQDLKKLLQGKQININLNDESYLLEYKHIVIGLINIQNKMIIKSKLFGKTIAKLIGD